MPQVDLYNLYGPTECTIDVSYCLCDDSKSVIPIGRPVWNTEISVVNGAGKRLPVNVTGELVVYGDLVGKYSNIFSDSASCKARAFSNASASGNDRESGYKRVHLVSSCVGSSMIISVARHLGENVGEIFICESLPYEGLFLGCRLYTIWDFMCDGIINAFFVFIRRKRFKADKRLLKDFRRDVYKSAEYLNYFTANELTPLKRKVNLIFGKKDFLTKGYKKKYGRWRKYIKGDFELYEIADAGHFLVEDNAREVYDIIGKVLNK